MRSNYNVSHDIWALQECLKTEKDPEKIRDFERKIAELKKERWGFMADGKHKSKPYSRGYKGPIL